VQNSGGQGWAGVVGWWGSNGGGVTIWWHVQGGEWVCAN